MMLVYTIPLEMKPLCVCRGCFRVICKQTACISLPRVRLYELPLERFVVDHEVVLRDWRRDLPTFSIGTIISSNKRSQSTTLAPHKAHVHGT